LRVLVNTLSVNHLSARHVVYGFLRQIAKWTAGDHELILLHYNSTPPPADISGEHIERLPVSDRLRHWAIRSPWETFELPRIVRRHAIDLVFTASGAITRGLKVPQVSLAQNPWAFVPQAQRGATQKFKAALQRRGYRAALHDASMMFFISHHLRSLYRQHANGKPETRTDIAYVGLDDETHAAAERMRDTVEKDPLQIISVSAMAPWKGAHTLVDALQLLHARGIDARLRLVGPWPDPSYEQHIRRQIAKHNLDNSVTITGHVTKDELHRHYAEARVFCLMSACESFGIPAAEAMAFGTPVVATEDCAVSEICRNAGLFGPPDAPEWTADALERLLTDADDWRTRSTNALTNAARLRWHESAQPLMQIFSH